MPRGSKPLSHALGPKHSPISLAEAFGWGFWPPLYDPFFSSQLLLGGDSGQCFWMVSCSGAFQKRSNEGEGTFGGPRA